jgi:uncharacterized membrane protein
MSARAGQAVVLAAVVLLVTAGAAGTAGAFDRPGTEQVVDADSTQLTVGLQPDGDATWEVEYRVQLNTQNDTEAFEQLRNDIRNDSTPYTDRFGDRMRSIASSAENATGREMAIRNVTVETRSQPSYGILVYRFEWENFAAVDGDTIRAGDAIDQFYLDADTTLEMNWPEGYVSDSVTPDATQSGTREVVWEGQLDFDPGQPRVVVVPQGETPVPPDGTTTSPATGGGDGGDSGSSLPLAVGALLVVLAAAAGGWWYTQRDNDGSGSDDGTPSAGAAATTGDGSEEQATEGDDGAAAGPPMELLSNEEKVLRLVEDNGGRMKQKQVVEELDWTAAKTSQVVGDLRDDEKLESFRLGRENVLTLPDVDLEPNNGDGDES